MIKTTMERSRDGAALAAEIAGRLSAKWRTNCYRPAEEWISPAGREEALRMAFPGGLYLLRERERQFDLFFFLEESARPVPLPPLGKPVVLEQVAAEKTGMQPTLMEWEAAGFRRYLQRRRLFLTAKDAEQEERESCFCGEAEGERIGRLFADSFEPYTSDLPNAGTLAADLREGRALAVYRDEKLAGCLRFGREKKVSVLRQVAVMPEARGLGVGEGLVRDWLALERAEVMKFQLWVREDNPPALRMYEKLGFRPDGRIAPVMIKE